MNIQNLNLIEPIEKEIDGKTFILSKFPAVQGREIICGYPLTGLPKLGDYKKNEEIMLKLMSFVAVPVGEAAITLSNMKTINSHVPSWETLMKLEAEMMEYNCSFFKIGRISNFFADFAQKLPQLVSKMLMGLLEQSPQPTKPASSNSEPSTV